MDPGCANQLQCKALFGQALSDVCEKNGNPPEPIMVCLKLLRQCNIKLEFVIFCIVCITNLQSRSCNLHVLFSCLQEILLALCRKGPYTEGVFRKAGNAKALKEIKEQLNNRVEVDLKTKPVILLADLLKVTLIELYCIYQFYLCCVEVYVVISKYVNTLNLIE